MIRGLEGSPVRRGKKSNLPASVNVAIAQISGEVTSLASDWYNANSLLQCVLLKHAKSGGGAYSDGDEYGTALGKKVGNRLKKMYAENLWDGTPEGLSAPPAAVAVEESYGEEE